MATGRRSFAKSEPRTDFGYRLQPEPYSKPGRGIVPEEYRVEYVVDRTQTFGRAFLGLTVECARCHDHKFDPISQKEYYQLFGFFNNVNESGKIPYVGEPSPTVILTDEETDKKISFIREQISRQEELITEFQGEFAEWLADLENGKNHKIELSGQIGYYQLDEIRKVKVKDGLEYRIENRVDSSQPATVKGAAEDHPILVDGALRKALEWPGREASWVEMDVGFAAFERNEPFAITFYLKILDNVMEGPLVGRCAGIHNGDRGYELFLEKDLRITANLVHVFPDNQITIATHKPLERHRWYHLAMTYDGSSKAQGLKLYLDGETMDTEIKMDNLVRSIIGYGKDKINWGADGKFRIGYKSEYAMKGIVVDELRIFNKKLTALEVEKINGKEDPYW